jgi:hypothetical protein
MQPDTAVALQNIAFAIPESGIQTSGGKEGSLGQRGKEGHKKVLS